MSHITVVHVVIEIAATIVIILERERRFTMEKYICPCGYEYDPELGDPDNGVAAGTAWEDVPEDWLCPWCDLGKDAFEQQ